MSARRVVFDCNTLVQALASPAGPAGQCVQIALEGGIDLFISAIVLEELRDVALRPKVMKKLKLQRERVEGFLEVLQRVGIFLSGFSEAFVYQRDPDDAHYVNLALAANAQLIVSRDRDLLDLMDESDTEGRAFMTRFPTLRIVTPNQFLADRR